MSSVGLPFLLLLLALPLGATRKLEYLHWDSETVDMLETQLKEETGLEVEIERPVPGSPQVQVVGSLSGDLRSFRIFPNRKPDVNIGNLKRIDALMRQGSVPAHRYYRQFLLEKHEDNRCILCGLPVPVSRVSVIEMEWLYGYSFYEFLDKCVYSIEDTEVKKRTALWLFGNAAVSINTMHRAGVYHYAMHLHNLYVDARPHGSDQLQIERVVVKDLEMCGVRPAAFHVPPWESELDFLRFCYEASILWCGKGAIPELFEISMACQKMIQKDPDNVNYEEIVELFKKAAETHDVALENNWLISVKALDFNRYNEPLPRA